ncbi:MAG: hypothetical protein RRX92_00885 [Lachnospiraceae bacterium]
MPLKEQDETEGVQDTAITDKKTLKAEKKKLKAEQKQQKKEAKAKAKELSDQAEGFEEEDSKPVLTVMTTAVIVLIWVVILCILIHLDVGGFGSQVLAPVLQDVPVVNKILPKSKMLDPNADSVEDEYYGYSSLKDAVAQIKVLELELEQAQSTTSTTTEDMSALQAEIDRLKTFEDNQVEFQRIKDEFYNEVVYADKGPGAEEYRKYYESIDPTTAEYLYKQVVQQLEETKEVTDYAKTYSAMKPKEAAAIFEAMEDNLDLAARILGVMSADSRGQILGAMTPEVAAKITKLMEPTG